MTNYRALIQQHELKLKQLKATVSHCFQRRRQSRHAWQDWQQALEELRGYRSEVDRLVERSIGEDIRRSPELREFLFGWVAVDPYFPTSGYIFEKLLGRLKKLDLTEAEARLIQKLILRRIDTKALRNFPHICRFIPRIATSDFIEAIEERLGSEDASIRHRAKLAASYLPR